MKIFIALTLAALCTFQSGAAQAKPRLLAVSVAEPVSSGKSQMLGGESGGMRTNDGLTIVRSGSLPTLDEVLAKYMEAMGGAAAIDKATSRIIKGELNVVGVSRGGSFEWKAQAPNKLITMLQAYPMGNVMTGFNGRTG